MIIRHRIAVYYNKYTHAEAPVEVYFHCALYSCSFHRDPSNPSINHLPVPPSVRVYAPGPQQISVTMFLSCAHRPTSHPPLTKSLKSHYIRDWFKRHQVDIMTKTNALKLYVK